MSQSRSKIPHATAESLHAAKKTEEPLCHSQDLGQANKHIYIYIYIYVFFLNLRAHDHNAKDSRHAEAGVSVSFRSNNETKTNSFPSSSSHPCYSLALILGVHDRVICVYS